MLPPAALHRFIRWWGQLHGLITLEVFGHLHWLISDAGRIYRTIVLQQADEIERSRPPRRLDSVVETQIGVWSEM